MPCLEPEVIFSMVLFPCKWLTGRSWRILGFELKIGEIVFIFRASCNILKFRSSEQSYSQFCFRGNVRGESDIPLSGIGGQCG
jgi:hypothetical protein